VAGGKIDLKELFRGKGIQREKEGTKPAVRGGGFFLQKGRLFPHAKEKVRSGEKKRRKYT